MNQSYRNTQAALISAVLRNPAIVDTLDGIGLESFDWQPYGWAWAAFATIKNNGYTVDAITLGDELERMGRLGEFSTHDQPSILGRMAIAELRKEPVTADNAQTYAALIADYGTKKKAAAHYREAYSWAENGRSASAIINDSISYLSGLQTAGAKADTHSVSAGQAASAAYDDTIKASDGKIVVAPSGLPDLDSMLSGGYSNGDLVIVAGRPGMGKTALLLTQAYRAAKEHKKKIGIFSLEMSNEQLGRRLIALESGIPYDIQKSGKLTPDQWPVFNLALETLQGLSIRVNDLPAINLQQMRGVIRKWAASGVDLIMVDYLQLMTAQNRHDNRVGEVSEVSRGLKMLAKEFNVPIIAAAQLSRAVEQRQDKRPVLSDLRESGSIEQDSDIVMFIHRPDMYGGSAETQNLAEIMIAKHRNGQVGSVNLFFRASLAKFESAATRRINLNEGA